MLISAVYHALCLLIISWFAWNLASDHGSSLLGSVSNFDDTNNGNPSNVSGIVDKLLC